MNKSEGSRDTE